MLQIKVMGLIFAATLSVISSFAQIRPPTSRLISVQCASRSEDVLIVLDFDRPVSYKVGNRLDSYRFYIDLIDARADSKLIQETKINPLVNQVHVTAQGAYITRVTADLKEPAEFTIRTGISPRQLIVIFRRKVNATQESIHAGEVPQPPRSAISINPESQTQATNLATDQRSGDVEIRTESESHIRTQDPGFRKLSIPRAIRPPRIEDFISKAPDDAGIAVTDFRQREPGDGTPASMRTDAYLSYDAENLYVVFVCADDPQKVRGRMSKRENISGDDTVTLYLDTFHDGQRAYYFTVNPLGVQADGVLAGGSTDGLFDTIWHSNGRITDEGYIVSVSIPFRSIRFSGNDPQTWGIALGRSIQRNNENSFWPSITRRQNSFVQQMGTADGISDIAGNRNIQFVPYGVFTGTRLLDPSTRRFETQTDDRFGLDTKMVIRNALALDLTANPDFSQVESDDPQVTANQRFEVLFPEKRPFFLENINYFNTPLRLLFTRRIADPQFGARLTGEVGGWNMGFLATDDRAPGKRLAVENPLYKDRALVGAARIQRDLHRDSNIGVLATEQHFGPNENRVYSTDTTLSLTPTFYFRGQMAYSIDRNPVTDRVGRAYSADLSHGGRNLSYGLSYNDISPDFRVPLGSLRRVDVRTASQYVSYFYWPETSKLLSFGGTASAGANWAHGGGLLDKYASVDFQMDFAGPFGFTLSRYDAYERYLSEGFRYATNSISFYANWSKQISLYGSASVGEGVNYATPEDLAPFLGNAQNFSFGFTWLPVQRMQLDEFYYFSRLNTNTQSVYTSHVARTRLNFQFSRALSVRGIVDYNSLLPNSALFNSDRYKFLTGDLLLTYLVNPGTALHLGYTDRFENLAADPEGSGSRRHGPPTYRTSHQLFLKLSYLFRF